MSECVCLHVLQHIWPRLQRPSVLSMSSISGPCQTNGSWLLSPGHVPRPLPGPPWLVETLFLASSKALLSINGSPLRPRLHSLKHWAPPERWVAVPSLPQPINRGHLSLPIRFAFFCFSLCRSLSEMAPHSTPLWALGSGLLAGFCLCFTGFFFLCGLFF